MLTLRSKALALGVTNFEASRAYLFDISTKLGCNVLKYGISYAVGSVAMILSGMVVMLLA